MFTTSRQVTVIAIAFFMRSVQANALNWFLVDPAQRSTSQRPVCGCEPRLSKLQVQLHRAVVN